MKKAKKIKLSSKKKGNIRSKLNISSCNPLYSNLRAIEKAIHDEKELN
jgi:hypothetical protein